MTISSTQSSTGTVLPDEGERLLTSKELGEIFGVNQATIYSWSAGKPEPEEEDNPEALPPFPKPIRRGEKFTRWRASEIRTWIAALPKSAPKVSPSVRAKAAP